MRKLLLLLIPMIAFVSCASSGSKVESAVLAPQELMETGIWTPLGSAGSTVEAKNGLDEEGKVNAEFISIDFMQAFKEGANQWPDIALIASLPDEARFTGMSKITLEYKCDQDLAIRLSQTDLTGAEYGGDESFALYQTVIVRSDEWKTKTIELSKLKQPSWTTDASRVQLKTENVYGIELSPQANYMIQATPAKLEVRSLIVE